MARDRKLSPVARAFADNERAIKRLLARFLPSRRDVDDLAQETFLRAFAAEAAEPIGSPRAFLFTTARNLALNEAQRLANTATCWMEDFPSPDVLGSERQPREEDKLYGRQKLLAFAEALAALPEQTRRVFVLRKVHGLSQKEVAAALGVTESTVEKQVATGLLRTSDFLRRRGFDVAQRGSGKPAASLRGRVRKAAADG